MKHLLHFAKAVEAILLTLGFIQILELTGMKNIRVDTMNITPAQASIIRNDLQYDTMEVLQAPKNKKRKN